MTRWRCLCVAAVLTGITLLLPLVVFGDAGRANLQGGAATALAAIAGTNSRSFGGGAAVDSQTSPAPAGRGPGTLLQQAEGAGMPTPATQSQQTVGGSPWKPVKPVATTFFCRNFFTVLATAQHGEETCRQIFPLRWEQISVLSSQMEEYGTNLTVYATRTEAERHKFKCQYCFPRVSVVDFEPEALLQKHGFTPEQIGAVKRLSYQQQSDLYRLALAQDTELAFIETDVVFLAARRESLLKEYVVAALWKENAGALEMTNSAFCIPPSRLEGLLLAARGVLNQKKVYDAADFNDRLFLPAMLNSKPLRVLSLNHPQVEKLVEIVPKVAEHGHLLLHLTDEIRRKAQKTYKVSYGRYVQDLMDALNSTRRRPTLRPRDGVCS